MSVSITPCGSEPTATAPPPFVPESAEVARGTNGETLTLGTTEAGGFTRSGEALATGTYVMAEANGSRYTLTLYGMT